jgi:glycosyltransferase involved in cell wall biosynthesis
VRIGVDASFIDPGRVGGAEHMLMNLVHGLAATAVEGDAIDVLTDHPWAAPAPVRFAALKGGGNRFLRITRTLQGRLDRYDAFLFANYFTPPFPRTQKRPRFVTVIHDLQYLHLAENFSKQKRAWLRATHEATLRLANTTVAISNDVRDDILASYGAKWASRVQTVHNPVSWDRFGPDAETGPPPVEGTYVLAVAAHYPHKNLETLIRAFAQMRGAGAHLDTKLVLAGQLGENLSGIAFYRPLRQVIDDLGLADAIHVTGYLDDHRLGDAYRHAAVFAFPSLFEGFALPPVEALGFGLPVLTSRRTAIPEVTLGIATYLDDPMDLTVMAERLTAMLDDPAAFRPSAQDVSRIRDTYAPARIGAAYRALLAGRTDAEGAA